MKILLEEHREVDVETRITFVDQKNAFSIFNRIKLLEIVQNDNIPQQIIQKSYNLYKTNLIGLKLKIKNQNCM
jgi:hypothetical protein